MARFAIIDPETLAPSQVYNADEAIDPSHVLVPGDLSIFAYRVNKMDDGSVTLVPNVEWQWTSVRAQQKQKLYESDWTCSVTDYEVPNKPEWVQYRQALRDVTTQSDPFAIVWPQRPSP
jgi:hypothetical protein